jgi:hypothetical protein
LLKDFRDQKYDSLSAFISHARISYAERMCAFNDFCVKAPTAARVTAARNVNYMEIDE